MGRKLARWSGPGLALLLIAIGQGQPDSLPWRTAAVMLWMGLWWLSEAVPLAVTALLPLVLFPLLSIPPGLQTAEAYANSTVFLFLGGFLLGAAMQRWGLHERLALGLLGRFARRPRHVVLGLLLSVAFLSMWMSNTATALVALPIALSILDQIPEGPVKPLFAKQVLLAVAYAASIGGVATIVGTPPNGILLGYLRQHHPEFAPGFAEWMSWGVPIAALMLLAAYGLLLAAFRYPEPQLGYRPEAILERRRILPPWHPAERVVLVVFLLTALLWLTRTGLGPWPGWGRWLPWVDDTTVVLCAALALFLWPVRDREGRLTRVLGGDWSRFVSWEVLLLFGGGFALAQGVERSGLDRVIGGLFAESAAWAPLGLMFAAAAVALLLTEFASNTATAALLVPLLAAAAQSTGQSVLALTVPAVIASSLGFMMPAGTPPNALVFASRYLHISDMVRVGLWLDLVGVLVLVAVVAALY
ncbi:MAG: DASS family sodium-coupled anion symporter [Bacteroidota bacterium]|nr:DASS family sodium-coupled anion symporter [Bacteroidota bacterium]